MPRLFGFIIHVLVSFRLVLCCTCFFFFFLFFSLFSRFLFCLCVMLFLFCFVLFCFVFSCQAEDARQIKIASPILNGKELEAIQALSGFKTTTLPTVYPLEKGPGGLKVNRWRERGKGGSGIAWKPWGGSACSCNLAYFMPCCSRCYDLGRITCSPQKYTLLRRSLREQEVGYSLLQSHRRETTAVLEDILHNTRVRPALPSSMESAQEPAHGGSKFH